MKKIIYNLLLTHLFIQIQDKMKYRFILLDLVSFLLYV